MNASYTFGMYNINSRSVYGMMFKCCSVTERVAERKTFAVGDMHTKHEQLAVKIEENLGFGGRSGGAGNLAGTFRRWFWRRRDLRRDLFVAENRVENHESTVKLTKSGLENKTERGSIP